MPANILDKFTDASSGVRPTSTTVSSIRNSGATTLACADLTGWPTGSAVHFVTYSVNASGDIVVGSQTDWKGIVSGSNINSLTVTGGTDSGNAAGDYVVMLPTAAWGSDLFDGLTASLNQVDGSLKDGIVTSSKINNGAVTNAKLSTTAGEVGGAWQSWTPTFTNFTLGNGTINTAKYTQVGKTVRFKIRITLGSTSSVSGVITVSLPVTAASDEVTPSSQPFTLIGIGTILDSGTTQYSAYFNVASTTTLTLLSENAASTSSQPQNTSATVPMTWATNDAFYVRGSYEAA